MVERRLIVLVVALAVWSAAIVRKLASLQLAHHQEYARKARQHQEVPRVLPAPRGSIYDRNGEPLAMSLPTQSVTVNPMKLPDLGVAADLLEQVLHMQGSGLYGKLKQAYENGRGYLVVKRQITPEEAAERPRAAGGLDRNRERQPAPLSQGDAGGARTGRRGPRGEGQRRHRAGAGTDAPRGAGAGIAADGRAAPRHRVAPGHRTQAGHAHHPHHRRAAAIRGGAATGGGGRG